MEFTVTPAFDVPISSKDIQFWWLDVQIWIPNFLQFLSSVLVTETLTRDFTVPLLTLARPLFISFIHSIGMCRMRRFLAILSSFFHSPLLHTFSCHPFPPTILTSSLTSPCHLFLGLPLNLVVLKFIYNTLLGILFPSILCTCPNQHNLFNLEPFRTQHPRSERSKVVLSGIVH